MSRLRLRHFITCFVIAFGTTLVWHALDAQRSGVHQTISGLTWARQVASQAEGMIFKAKENGEKDPISWAISYLAQGVEPRLVHLSRAQVKSSDDPEPEIYSFDSETGVFDYTKILVPASGAGVHITIALGYVGFLGCKTAIAADFLAIFVFALIFASAFFATSSWFGFNDLKKLTEQFALFKNGVLTWLESSKTQLTQHGGHVREMVRQAQRLSVITGRSRQFVSDLRFKIHEGLSELHENRTELKEGETLVTHAQTLAHTILIESKRINNHPSAAKIATLAEELQRKLNELGHLTNKSKAMVEGLERRIEPWSTDADLAYQSFEDVGEATALLSQHITRTTESLVSQAKLIQGARQEFGAIPVAPTSPTSMVSAPQSEPTLTLSAPPAAAAPIGLPEPLPPIDDQVTQSLFGRSKAKKSA